MAESAETVEMTPAAARPAAFLDLSVGAMNRIPAVACLAVLLFGAVLRLANVNNVTRRTPDERVYTGQAKVLVDRGVEGSRSMVADFLHNPALWIYPPPTRVGYSTTLAAAMQLTGVRTESVGAWLSCVASIGALGLAMLIGYRFFHPWVGVTAGLFLSVFPPELVVARRTWAEALINLLTLIMIYCAFGIAQNPNLRWRYAALAAAGGWLLLIKEYTSIVFGLCILWAGLELARRKRWRECLFLAGSAFAGLVCAAIAFNVAAGGLEVWLRTLDITFAANATNQYVIQYCSGPGYLLAAGFWILSPLVTLLAGTAILLALTWRGFCFIDPKNGIGLAAFTLLWAAVPAVLPHWMSLRYVSVLNAPLCLLAAIAVCQIWLWMRASLREREVMPAVALGCLVVALSAVGDYQRFHERFVETQTPDLAIRMLLDFPQ
jgi:hypothetical protein